MIRIITILILMAFAVPSYATTTTYEIDLQFIDESGQDFKCYLVGNLTYDSFSPTSKIFITAYDSNQFSTILFTSTIPIKIEVHNDDASNAGGLTMDFLEIRGDSNLFSVWFCIFYGTSEFNGSYYLVTLPDKINTFGDTWSAIFMNSYTSWDTTFTISSIPSPIPEPSSILMFAIGIILLSLHLLKTRRKKNWM